MAHGTYVDSVSSTADSGTAAAAAATTTAASSGHGGHGSSSSSTSSAKSAKALIYTYVNKYPLYWWYLIGAIGGAFLFVHVARIIHQRIRRNRSIQRSLSTSATTEFGSASASTSGVAMRVLNTALVATRKGFSWREWTIALWWKVTAGELVWSTVYLLVTLLFGLLHMPVTNTTASSQASMVANRTGVLAYCQIPLIIGLASKNQVLSYLTGIPYEKLNFLHRASGRACLILAWIHTIGWWWVIGMTGHHTLAQVDMQWGVVATFAYTLLVIGGFKPLRNAFYELFLLSHIALALLYLVACYLHWPRMSYWVYPGFVIWAFDRLARVVNTVILNKLWLSLRPRSTNPACHATVRCVADDALELRIPRANLRWQAGQHVYIMCPTISWLSAHPFTVASVPPADKAGTPEVLLIVRACDGFTKNLARVAREAGGETEVLTCVEGPYGYVRALDSYESVVLIAGGSGVSYTLSLLTQIVRDCQAGKSAVRAVTFVWIIPTSAQIEWIATELADAVRACPSTLMLDLQIFVTREASTIPVLTEKAASGDGDSGASSPDARISTEVSGTASSSSSVDEKTATAGHDVAPKALAASALVAKDVRHGRPDFRSLFTETIAAANGGAMSVNMCGPSGMTHDVKMTLAARDGPYSLADVAKGRSGILDIHYESFGW